MRLLRTRIREHIFERGRENFQFCGIVPERRKIIAKHENIHFDGSPFYMSLDEFTKTTRFQWPVIGASENSQAVNL